jgi:hypothetical protein
MNRIVIGWRCEPFTCEFREERQSGWLQVFQGDELVLREPADSVRAAFQRAHDFCEQLLWRRAQGA